ncbi:MAG: 2-hydroxychromene-2-carboxylate isomerase [Alphaproteobacteria bacterium]|nr:2-hydroxychromene-2-carboxylate isomerase [Alphaproteobacteria bacterium]MCB9929129.1 2-hydroxychromene-2-carboxylate isomerase [Alphaproteobacteria bacterium]
MTVTSPWTFLGHEEFSEIVTQAGVSVAIKPVDFGAVFAVSGGLPLPQRPKQRQRYRLFELQRWRRKRGIPLNLHPKHFPADPNLGNRAVLAAAEAGLDAMAFADQLMRGVWCEDRNVADPDFVREAARSIAIDGDALLAEAQSDAIAARYAALTEEAKAAAVFGAPFYIVNGEPFWGQDRLDFVRDALIGGAETLHEAE